MYDSDRDPLIPGGPINDVPASSEFIPSEGQEAILRQWLKLSGVELGDYDQRIITWASRAWDWSTFATVTSWIRRADEAGYERARQAYAPKPDNDLKPEDDS